MLFRLSLLALPFIFILTTLSFAQPPAKLLMPGENSPTWEELPGVDDKPHSLVDFRDKDVLVIAFTCNSCPYAVEYEDRFIAFAKKHAGADGRVAFIAINANQVAEDLPVKMKEKAEKKGFPFPYLFDATQDVARAHGALYTPECFVFNKDRVLMYRGAFDDNPTASDVKTPLVENAVVSVLAGEEPKVRETTAIGCAVRYARKKRGR